MRKKTKPTVVEEIMYEVIEFPGFPQLLVTRHFAYQYLKGCGWSERDRGFGSLDYIVFSRPAIGLPATVIAERDYYLGQVQSDYVRT